MVKLALENLEKHFPEKLKGKRLGAVLHPASITANLRHTYLFHRHKKDFAWKPPPYEYEFKKLPIDILLGNGSYRESKIDSLD